MRNVTRDRKEEKPAAGKKKKVILIVAAAILVPLIVVFSYVLIKMNALNSVMDTSATMPPETAEPVNTKIPEANASDINDILKQGTQTVNPNDLYTNPKAINILLLGLDTRNPKQFSGGRTDSIIIITLDTVNKEIKLTSVMRDTLVSIPGHDLNRINTVFGFAGPDAAVDTIQKYFGVKVDYYAVVNFWAVANIIDSVGGVTIDVKSAEIGDLNKQLDEINKYSTNGKSAHVSGAGSKKLNGKQAVAYMRIRHVGDADFERTERQRRVLQAIANKDLTLPEVLSIVDKLPDNVRTNASSTNMVSLANLAFTLKSSDIKQLRLPANKTYRMSRYKGMSILIVDFDKNKQLLLDFLKNK